MSPRSVAGRRQRHHRCHHRGDRGLMPGNRCLSEGGVRRGENRQQPRARAAVRAIASASNRVWPWLRGARLLEMTHPRTRRLVCVGSAVVDIVMKVPALPEPGGDIVAGSSRLAVGGAFNVMAAARDQGATVTYAGSHGTGSFGDMVRASLVELPIERIAPRAQSLDTRLSITLSTGSRPRD